MILTGKHIHKHIFHSIFHKFHMYQSKEHFFLRKNGLNIEQMLKKLVMHEQVKKKNCCPLATNIDYMK